MQLLCAVQDLIACIDTDFPAGTALTPLEQERESHEAFADARRRVYIGREAYFNEISAYMSSHKPHPLVILGESGQFQVTQQWLPSIKPMTASQITQPNTCLMY